MPITQLITTVGRSAGGGGGGGPGGEAGTPGNSITWQQYPPTSNTTWPASVGADATINGGTLVGSGDSAGISLNGGYINVPVNLNRGYWTVELVCELNPTSFWASIWGNDVWNSNLGYVAYLGSTSQVQVGSPNGTSSVNVSNIGTKAYWAFTNNGGQLTVYRNGVQLSIGSGYVFPNDAAGSNLFIGSRHANDGNGPTDSCPGTYYYIRARDYAIVQSEVDSAFSALQATYSI
jgi:hypothetical protein